jgi:nicotinamidase-related amidase
MTLVHLPDGMTDLARELTRFVPPGKLIDKALYSPWIDTELDAELKRRKTDALSGSETDVCVLATALGAVDRG